MKAIRYIASILLLTAGALHIYLFAQDPQANNSWIILVFGITYPVIGILLFLKMKYSHFAGIIVPLGGIICGLAAFDPGNLSPLIKVMGI